ncbi:MAG TPA: tRNA (guanosine(46)-N7)-methyltransferase TrmB [Verrucomicrobiota bacterium]|nr:tRNA (guanosine(46)-N7)-methyltransferase TrmB [Verrucomicrobiota bacterium]HNU49718.1 tRNA (guanosine(46)-N7)-methyltransferase TrmB [Verrucomicrobiota bacterium]
MTRVVSGFIVRVRSIAERCAWADFFPVAQLVEVELGSGDGSFLVEWARRHPDRNFLGIERLLGRLRKLDRKGRRAGLRNLRGLRLEAGYCLEYILPLGGIAALHVYFPDPWPKRKHWRRRLVNDRFPGLAARVLAPGGTVYLRTDHEGYAEEMRRVFGGSAMFEAVPTPPDLAGVVTDFERGFAARGIGAHRLAYRLR